MEKPFASKAKCTTHVHSVDSFRTRGRSRSNINLMSSPRGMIKTVLSILFLLPGILLGAVFKGLAYSSSNVRKNHHLTKEHFTPVNET